MGGGTVCGKKRSPLAPREDIHYAERDDHIKMYHYPPMSVSANLFADVPDQLHDELVSVLLNAANVRIERIVSIGQCSPKDFWYDQPRPEWVLVAKGHAKLRYEDADVTVELKPGDFVNIPAHRRHRVDWTTPDEPTVWLAIHYDG